MEPWGGGLTRTRSPITARRPEGSAALHTIRYMMTVAQAAVRLGQDRETVRNWIRSGRLRAQRITGRYVVDLSALRAVEDELFPMAELPDEWKLGDDGSPAPNWVAALRCSRSNR